MTEANFVGCVVSIDCGETLGWFQGEVSSVDASAQTVSLIKAFRNGLQCLVPEITISACDIQNLEILRRASEINKSSLPSLSNGIIVANGHANSNFSGNATQTNSSPMRGNDTSTRLRAATVSEARHIKPVTPRKNPVVRRRLLEDDCLNAPISDDVLATEFDFEKNLALFDKRAVFDAIDAVTAGANGVGSVVGTRLVDINLRPPLPLPPPLQSKYRCDEHVLEQRPVVHRQIDVPEVGRREFVTDSGLVVPSITLQLRDKLLSAAENAGMSRDRQTELVGRAASDMVIQLLGGGHRLNPRNSHQTPTAVLLCGPCWQGVQALSCGRHLANHGVKVHAFVSKLGQTFPHLMQELALFKLTEGSFTVSADDLPNGTTDIIVNALDGHMDYERFCETQCYADAVGFASKCTAPVLTMDPPADDGILKIKTKWSLMPVLPLDVHSSCGSIYLCDLAIPKKVFSKVGITYQSPFGPKCVIPLHDGKRSDDVLL